MLLYILTIGLLVSYFYWSYGSKTSVQTKALARTYLMLPLTCLVTTFTGAPLTVFIVRKVLLSMLSAPRLIRTSTIFDSLPTVLT